MTNTCGYCRASFEPDEPVAACPACGTPHHPECFAENGGCTVFGCSRAPVDEPKLSISNADVAPATAYTPAASFLNLQAAVPVPEALPRPASLSTPPPPRLGPSSLPPPHLAPVFAGFSSYGNSSLPAQAWIPYARRKSRVVFVLLAVFFGAFGGHNFYAGYTKKGVIQACITAFSCFFGSLISWVWAIVEACTIEQDSNGNAFI